MTIPPNTYYGRRKLRSKRSMQCVLGNSFYTVSTREALSECARSFEAAVRRLDDANDDTKKTESASKDFDDENLDEQSSVLGVRQRATATRYADANAVHAFVTPSSTRNYKMRKHRHNSQ